MKCMSFYGSFADKKIRLLDRLRSIPIANIRQKFMFTELWVYFKVLIKLSCLGKNEISQYYASVGKVIQCLIIHSCLPQSHVLAQNIYFLP